MRRGGAEAARAATPQLCGGAGLRPDLTALSRRRKSAATPPKRLIMEGLLTRRDGTAPQTSPPPDEMTPAERRRLMQMIEARLNAAHNGDLAQYRREISALTKRSHQLMTEPPSPRGSESRRNFFERIRDFSGHVHEELAIGGLMIAFVAATTIGVFGPFLLVFGVIGLLG